jgi:transposase-like protein
MSEEAGPAAPSCRLLSKVDKRNSSVREKILQGADGTNNRAVSSLADQVLLTTPSHLPFRRREHAMQRFRSMRSLQKFTAVHASVSNHFNQERHLYSRKNFKANRAAALAKWRVVGAA